MPVAERDRGERDARRCYLECSLRERDFRRLGGFIESLIGIRMPPVKMSMVESRLRKRLRILGLRSFPEYLEYLFSPAGSENEVVHLLDAVTTNKTDFFREPSHFVVLLERVLPRLVNEYGCGVRAPLRAWSAGCSSGEEPYTLAMFLSEFASDLPGFSFDILGTDISTRALETAARAVYPVEKSEPVPREFRRRYLMKSRDPERGLVRIVPELRSRVRFRRLNLMDHDLGLAESFDIVFFRNVLIYFDRNRQEQLVRKISRHLRTGGHLFVGHSETLLNLDLPLLQVSPMVYRKA